MARAVKDSVEYFPHYCDHGKTLFIIEQHYGNDGYSFWFKVLELLGKTNGHFYDCSSADNWEFLQAKTRFLGLKCQEILDKLALLGAIDKPLWEERRIIWSDNLINNIADVYKNRKRPVPQKPLLLVEMQKNSESLTILPVETLSTNANNDVSTPENTQSKVKESRVKENKPPISPTGDGEVMDDEFDSTDKLSPDVGNPSPEVDGRGIGSDGGPHGELSAAEQDQQFMAFWTSYPKKQGMVKAFEAWQELIEAGVKANDLIMAAGKYAMNVRGNGTANQFIKYPRNFLAEKTYIDHLPRNKQDCTKCRGVGWVEGEEEDGYGGVKTVMMPCQCRKVNTV